MWSKETKEEKERKKEQAFYEHYSAMGKSTQIPLEESGRGARGMNYAFDASRDEGELQSY